MMKRPALKELNYGKKYEVVKAWSREPVPGITTLRYSLSVGEIIRFIGPNWDWAYFRTEDKKKVCLPVKVAFRILRAPLDVKGK